MIDIWIIYDTERIAVNAQFADMLMERCFNCGIGAEVVLSEDIDGSLQLPKAVIMRTVNYELSQYLERHGVRVFNSAEVSQLCNDKWTTYQYALSLGLPIMKSALIDSSDLMNIFDYPQVIKSRDGHGGSEVFLVHNSAELIAAYNAIGSRDVIIQDVASNIGKDLRCYIINNRVVCAMLRESVTDFRSNFSLGGSAIKVELNQSEIDMIYRFLNGIQFDFVGIDLIFNEGKPIFNEIEDVVGCRMVYEMTDIDIADIFIQYVRQILAELPSRK